MVWVFVGFLLGGGWVFCFLFLERRGCEDAALASRSATYSSEYELCPSRETRDHISCADGGKENRFSMPLT